MIDDKHWVEMFSKELGKEYFHILAGTVQLERQKGSIVLPPEGDAFRCFKLTPFDDLKVVIIADEARCEEGQSDGLAFSVPNGVPIPEDLQNIFNELHSSLGVDKPKSGDLSSWASSGILLLNETLTVERGLSGSHAALGWKKFTDNCIKYISDNKERVVFCFWCTSHSKAALVDRNKHLVLKGSNPASKTANAGFSGSGHFIYINEATKLWE